MPLKGDCYYSHARYIKGEKEMTKTVRSLLFVFLMASLVLAACGGGSAPAEEPSAPVEEPAAPAEPSTSDDPMAMYAPDAVSGDVVIAGSSTVFPLAERMIERFAEEGYDGNATYDSIGSGAGFERFCVSGESDVSGASRAIKDSEVESCRSIGREPLEFRLGTDALSVVVSKDNDFVTDVTTEELALIFGTATNWSDVRSEWPAEPIQRFIPGTDSGTFDYFVEHVYDSDETTILAASNTQLSEDDNILVQGVLGSPYAIGFFGYAYYAENADTLNVLSVDGVEPNQATVDDNSYPLSRPLFHYTDASILKEKPQVAAYIYFFLTHVNDEIGDVGYFPANDAVLAEAMNALMETLK
jgi:phosphate transport system substrate-binding protein